MAKKQSQRRRAKPAQGPAEPVSIPAAAPQINGGAVSPAAPVKKGWAFLALTILFFIMSLFTVASTMKGLAIVTFTATIAVVIFRLPVLGRRMTLPFAAVTLWVVMCGISTLYAIAGKFALQSFLRLAVGYCVFLLFIAFARDGEDQGRGWATLLAGASALAGLVSIDMLSTHLISGPVQSFLGLFTRSYAGIASVSVNTRMTSIYLNPNVFAGVSGMGVMLSLGLANTAKRTGERRFQLCCLFLNALSFVLVFSMGGSTMISLGFLAFLLLEAKQRRGPLLVLMVETFVLVLAATFPIFLTSFGEWNGFQPVPLLCAAGGALLLCLADRFIGSKLADVLAGRGKLVLGLLLGVLAAVGVYVAVALNVTGGVTLKADQSFIRAAYLAPGEYTLEVEANQTSRLRVYCETLEDAMRGTRHNLYDGDSENVAFTVPEDSQVVFFQFLPDTEVRVESANYRGAAGQGSLKLKYLLLPGFVANRIQGVFANHNAIQRTVYFRDGMKLFQRSPVFGLGMGAFENAVCSVQNYFYETKYAHHHYIQMLVETGAVGLVLFLAVLGLSGAAVLKSRRREDASPLTAALGGALVFMAGHAVVEMTFSENFFLLTALGVFALISLCCGGTLPLLPEREHVRKWLGLGIGGLLAVYAVLLGLNMRANQLFSSISSSPDPFGTLKSIVVMDRFEWKDYMLTYVYNAVNVPQESPVRAQADEYAAQLMQAESNSAPLYVARYYFGTDQVQKGFAALEKYGTYVVSDPDTWKEIFQLLESEERDTGEFREGVARLYQILQDWNATSIGPVKLSEQAEAFVQRVAG